MTDTQALILTLELDAVSTSRFEALRQMYYPPERNIVPAHLCLFHALPGGAEEAATLQTVRAAVADMTCRFLSSSGPRSIGRGVAVFFEPAPIVELHTRLARAFAGKLHAQDRQGFRPHVVLQNKVEPERARAALAALTQEKLPESVAATGLLLWRYLGGPWDLCERIAFHPQTEPA